MAWTRRSIGTKATGFNTAITPGAPAGFAAGDLLIYGAGEFLGSDTPPALSGWTLLTSAARSCGLYGRVAVGGDTIPAITWGTSWAFAFCAAYIGGPATLTGLLDIINDRGTSSTLNFAGPSLATPSNANELILELMVRNKTATSDGTPTIANYLSFVQQMNDWPSGSKPTFLFQDWIQTTATSVAVGGNGVTGVTADGSSQSAIGVIAALIPLGGAPVPATQQTMTMGVG